MISFHKHLKRFKGALNKSHQGDRCRIVCENFNSNLALRDNVQLPKDTNYPAFRIPMVMSQSHTKSRIFEKQNKEPEKSF